MIDGNDVRHARGLHCLTGEAAATRRELDKFCYSLLLCCLHSSRVREEGVNPSRSRRCQWGRNPEQPLSRT